MGKNYRLDHGFRLVCQRSRRMMERERESREGLGLRGDQCFVIWSGVYFFSAPVLLPSSPPHHPDQYSASTKVWKKAYEHVSQSTLTELKAMEFEISQTAASVLSPFVWLSAAQGVECIHCRCRADSWVNYLDYFTNNSIQKTQRLSSFVWKCYNLM